MAEASQMNYQDTPEWYALHTHAGKEKTAKSNLISQGIEVFAPKTKVRKPNGAKHRFIDRPFFPRYIFARFPYFDLAHDVRYTRGVSRIVEFGGQPAIVSPEMFDAIRERIVDGYVVLSDAPKIQPSGFIQGEKVRFCGGAWQGFEGIFQGDIGDDVRVHIMLENLTKPIIFTGSRLAIASYSPS